MDVGDRISVRDGTVIERTIVSTWPPVSWGFLRNHVQWRGPGAGGWADDS